LEVGNCPPNRCLSTVVLVLVLRCLVGGRKLSTKEVFLYGHTITSCMKTIWRSEIVHQIDISVQSSYCYLLHEDNLEVRNCSPNSCSSTVVVVIVLRGPVGGQKYSLVPLLLA
jgi:hypothetical protein